MFRSGCNFTAGAAFWEGQADFEGDFAAPGGWGRARCGVSRGLRGRFDGCAAFWERQGAFDGGFGARRTGRRGRGGVSRGLLRGKFEKNAPFLEFSEAKAPISRHNIQEWKNTPSEGGVKR